MPRWDGSHLIWAWFRYREQHVFWPWDKALPNHRADTEVPPLDFLYRGAVELLEAGADYPVNLRIRLPARRAGDDRPGAAAGLLTATDPATASTRR